MVQRSDKEAMIRLMEENEAGRKMIGSMSEGSEVVCLAQFQKLLAGVRNRWGNSKRESEGQLKKSEEEESQERQSNDRTGKCVWEKNSQRNRECRGRKTNTR